jgi:hypothetical protein
MDMPVGGMPGRSRIARQSQGIRTQSESNDTMAILAASTGGLFFHNNNDLDLGLREHCLLPEYSYSLAFVPPGAPDGKYHPLKVRLKQSGGYEVQARPGYFAAAINAAEPPPAERRIDQGSPGARPLEQRRTSGGNGSEGHEMGTVAKPLGFATGETSRVANL